MAVRQAVQDSTPASSRMVVVSDFADDPEYRELLELFIESISNIQRELQAAFTNADIDRLLTLAHQLKGSGGGHGFPEMTALAAELQEACQFPDGQCIEQRLHALLDYLSRISLG